MASIRQQINFEYWANSQSLAAIIVPHFPVPEALSILAHSVAISNSWAARVEGAPGDFDPWPVLSASELDTELIRLRQRWTMLATDTTPDAEIRYRSTKGENCSNRFDEILQEVFLHGAHHRGQIALTLRLKGFEPPLTTDFIPALRSEAVLQD
jgi:uncharacterized damage-inducible protein DinB